VPAPTVSVVIPNYNGADIVPRCFPATHAAVRGEAPEAEILVVDDASRDDSAAWVEARYPDVRVIRNPGNLGFGGTVNRGVREASGDRIVLFNTDVLAEPGFLAPALAHFADSAVFAVTFQALTPAGAFREGPNRVVVKSGLPHTYHDPRDQRTDARGRTLASYPVGGHCVIDRGRFLDLGGYSPLFESFYWEDADLGLRAGRRGWVTVYEPRSRVVHLEKGVIRQTFRDREIRRVKLRNRFLAMWNAYPPAAVALRHVLPVGLRFLAAAARGDREFFAAYGDARRRWAGRDGSA